MAPVNPLNIPQIQTAIIASSSGEFLISNNVPVIALSPDTVLIKTIAVALNPVDTRLLGEFVTPGATFGFDCSGIIIAVGSSVTKDVRPGDRVCGSPDGMNRSRPTGGAFAEYVGLPGDLTLKIPDSMSFEDAASLGTALASACMAIFWSLKIPTSLLDEPISGDQKRLEVLVYGGSTSSGTMMIQLLNLCGITVISTSSPRNFAFVKSYGATAVFDYTSPDCASTIRVHTKNTLAYAIDCITQASSAKICYGAIGRAGGRYTALDPYPEKQMTRKIVKPDWILATRIAGQGSEWPEPYRCEAEPKLKEFSRPLYATLQRLLDGGRIRNHPGRVCEGGWEGVLNGVGVLRRGEVSGEKLVYRVADSN